MTLRPLLLGALGSVVVVAGGCAGSTRSASPATTTTSAPAAVSAPAPTVSAAGPTAADDVQTACRSFDSFGQALLGVAEYGTNAAGEIGGMVQDVGEALAMRRTPAWVRLHHQLADLERYALSKAWPETGRKVHRATVYRAVAASCRGVS